MSFLTRWFENNGSGPGKEMSERELLILAVQELEHICSAVHHILEVVSGEGEEEIDG